MTSPRLVKGGLVQLDPGSGRTLRVIALQYNPDTLTRSLQLQGSGARGRRPAPGAAPARRGGGDAQARGGDRRDGPARASRPERRRTVERGLHPEIAALELLVQPRSEALQANDALAGPGCSRWCRSSDRSPCSSGASSRVVPVRVTDLSITEEAFDARLNPIRVKVSLGLRVLSVDDLGFDHRGGTLFMGHLRSREAMAAQAGTAALSTLGTGGDLTCPTRSRPCCPPALVPSVSFPPTSRVRRRGVATYAPVRAPGEEAVPVAFLRRRLVPAPGRGSPPSTSTPASRATGETWSPPSTWRDAELWWRLADANGVIDPREHDRAGRPSLRVTLPAGVPGASDG